MKTYATEKRAFQRQSYLARNFGIWSGVQRVGNRWRLLHDPDDLFHDHGPRSQLRDVVAEYVDCNGEEEPLVFEETLP